MKSDGKKFKLANVVLASAIALALAGCGDENMYPDAPKPPVEEPNPPVDPAPTYGNDFVIFEDKVNAYWPTWDCCGGTQATNPQEDAPYGLVTEFSVGETPAVLGFVRAESEGPLDISEYEATGTLEFDIKLVKAPAGGSTQWFVKLESNGGNIDNDGEAAEVEIPEPITTWQSVKINIADLANQGLDLTSLDNVLIFPAWDTGAGAVYRVDNIKFVIDGNTTTPDPDPEPNPDADSGLKFDLTQPLTDFGGNHSELVADPAPSFSVYGRSTHQVVKTLKTDGAEVWAGTTIGDKPVIDFAEDRTKISVWVYSEHSSTKVRLKVENQLNSEQFVEVDAFTTVANAWEKLTFDFALPASVEIDPEATYDQASLFFDFGEVGTGKEFYWQDVTFVEAEETTNPDPDPEPNPDEKRIVLFNDAANPQWAAWDCCANSTPEVIQDSDPAHGAVTKFEINGATVVGFTARDGDGAVGGTPIDVSAWAETGTVSFDLKLIEDVGATDWKLKLESAGGSAAEVSLPATPVLNTWTNQKYNLKDLAQKGLDLSAIDLVMMYPAWGTGIGSKFLVDNVVFSSVGFEGEGEQPDPELPPVEGDNLVVNGNFSGTDIAPWSKLGDGSVQVIDGAVRTSAIVGNEARIKQTFIGQGKLTDNQSVTLMLRMKGKLTDGGAVNAILHTVSPTGVTGTEVIQLPAPTADWSNFSTTLNIGPNPGHGLDLTLGGVCGAVSGCEVTVDFDDIQIIAN